MAARRLIVDVHTHVYLPRYANLLRSRTSVPRIVSAANNEDSERLLILDHEPSGGRPVGAQYWQRDEKLKFMDMHGISMSIVSSANPWLDFLPASEASKIALELNQDLEDYCETSPNLNGTRLQRLYGFGLLPLVPEITTSTLLETVQQISQLPHLKGLIMGTKGVGKGLDDPALDPVWAAIERAKLTVFLHPHYGVGGNPWGEVENGHVLPLALGFPFETTIAITRLILSGALDRFPSLRILLAHSGGALPQLSSRLASCIHHDPLVASRLNHDARYYIGRLYYDAVAYGSEELEFVSSAIGRAINYSPDGKSAVDIGSRRMMFGTDHPFFPPLSATEKWPSVTENLDAIEGVQTWSDGEKDGVLGGNALTLFDLQE
ncbi:hypothetical protein HGRIS_009401 [Hohenbuehelia grisea]|uniref:Amidohydrolase-related domain-containing protein n=1 Tax=Hohenbuehelia grisea TaxID=104357 RepID=A0ABR3J1A3_9AGAR